jgi:hypothetical protein
MEGVDDYDVWIRELSPQVYINEKSRMLLPLFCVS